MSELSLKSEVKLIVGVTEKVPVNDYVEANVVSKSEVKVKTRG
jgi:hypothetical protein